MQVYERELWTGNMSLAFEGCVPFAAPGRVWTTLTPSPVGRFSISFEGAVVGVPQLKTGAARLQIAGTTYEHGVIVSRVESHTLYGQFNGPPPPPSGQALTVTFGVLNLDPRSLWLNEIVVEGWRFRLTSNPDVALRQRLRDELGVAETHAGILDRADGGSFDAEEAIRVLDGWRLAMSFGTGSRIGIWRQVLSRPQDFVDDGWRAFASPSVDPWHDHHRIVDANDGFGIPEVVALVLVRRAADPDQAAIDELAMNFALEANGTAPVEMRIAAAGAGLELIAWDRLVEDSGDDSVSKAVRKRRYAARSASDNLALLLATASIDTEVPTILRSYASIHSEADSGAVAVAALRNRVMHPRRRVGELSLPGEVWAAGWQLAVQYLELLILHRLGYCGRYSDRFRSEWVGRTFVVPWAPLASTESPN